MERTIGYGPGYAIGLCASHPLGRVRLFKRPKYSPDLSPILQTFAKFKIPPRKFDAPGSGAGESAVHELPTGPPPSECPNVFRQIRPYRDQNRSCSHPLPVPTAFANDLTAPPARLICNRLAGQAVADPRPGSVRPRNSFPACTFSHRDERSGAVIPRRSSRRQRAPRNDNWCGARRAYPVLRSHTDAAASGLIRCSSMSRRTAPGSRSHGGP